MSTTVKRLQYDTTGSEAVLGLPATEITETHDGAVQVGGVSIDDAFDIDDLSLSGVGGTGLVALAAEIAEKQAEERCLPDKVTGSLVVPGFKMQDKDNLSIMVGGEAVYEDGEVTVDALSDEEVQTRAKMSAEALAKGLGAKAVTVFPMSTEVSYAGTLGGVSVLCDRRKSMAGYSVSGATEVAWVPVPKSWWDGLGTTVQSALLAVLGIRDRVQSHISDLTTLSVSDGAITPAVGEVTDLTDKSRVFFTVNGGSDRQFAEVGVDGDGMMKWGDNESYVVGILAAVPRVNMQSVLGIAAVCVGIGGGVPGWMVTAFKTYGIPIANLTAAFAIDSEIKKSFDGTGRYIYSDGTGYFDTALELNASTFEAYFKIMHKAVNSSEQPVISIWTSSYNYWNLYINSSNALRFYNSANYELGTITIGNTYEGSIVYDGTKYTVNANSKTITTNRTAANPTTLKILGRGDKTTGSKVAFYQLNLTIDTDKHFFIPIIKDSVPQLIDLVTMTYPTKVGTFTIE